jgi:hypothetical protein
MTTFPLRRTEFTSVPLKRSPAVLIFEPMALEILVEREVPAGTIRGDRGGVGAGGTGVGAGGVADEDGAADAGVAGGAGTAPVADWPGGGAACSVFGVGFLHAVRNIESENAIPRTNATRGW